MAVEKYGRTDAFRIARYLLNYSEANAPKIGKQHLDASLDPRKYTDTKILQEASELLHILKAQEVPALTVFQQFRHESHAFVEHEEQEHHSEMLEEERVYDKFLLATLKEFVVMTIAFLTKLEKMHRKGILCGNISPYNFMYIRKRKICEPYDLSVVLSDKAQIHAENQEHGDLIYVITDLINIPENQYLAPELRESVHRYNLQRRLKNIVYVAEMRGLQLPQLEEIKRVLLDIHQKRVAYSNKAEIYSVGYSINQIFSHMLEKLARLNLFLNQPINSKIPMQVLEEAESLLPRHGFANPYQERIPDLVNEAVEYIYDLMHERIEQRDSLPESIEKFMSLLKRISMTKPDSILEHEENEEEELAGEILHEEIEEEDFEEEELDEEHEEEHEEHLHSGEHAHEEHAHQVHDHDHEIHSGEHGNGEHDHGEHEDHEHSEHEHGDHEHGEHEHGDHEHGDHEHSDHEHGEHEHGDHEHGEHEHGDHEHGDHEHGDHEHGDHEHGDHEHGDHEHGDHEHGDHEHGDHEHGDHEHGEHEGEHGEGEHGEGGHGEGEHGDEGHGDGGHEDHEFDHDEDHSGRDDHEEADEHEAAEHDAEDHEAAELESEHEAEAAEAEHARHVDHSYHDEPHEAEHDSSEHYDEPHPRRPRDDHHRADHFHGH